MRHDVCWLMGIIFSLLSLLSCSNGGGSDGGALLQTYTVRYEFESPNSGCDITYWNKNNEIIELIGINTGDFAYEFQTSDVMQTIGIIGSFDCTGPYCSSVNVPIFVRLFIDGVLVAEAFDSGPWPEAAIGPDTLYNFLDLLEPEPEPHVTIFLDAFIVNVLQQSMVFWNDGFGYFSLSGQSTWPFENRDAAMGDLDGDGDLDAFVVASQGGCCDTNQVYLVDEFGIFYYTGQGSLTFGQYNSFAVALGDLDGDGDLDAFVANYGEPNKVYFNDGLGIFSDAGQSLDLDNSYDVGLGDLDGDGDLDAFVVNDGEPNKIYLNDGSGFFSDSGQVLGNDNSTGIALGDVNGDSYIDAFVTNEGQANRIYVNDSLGVFADSGQELGLNDSFSVDLGDVDGDGDLDAAVANRYAQPNKLYFNDGAGIFTDSGQELDNGDSVCVILGRINP